MTSYHLLSGKSHDDFRPAIQGLATRIRKLQLPPVQYWTSDCCCTDKALIQKEMGNPDLEVRKDIFHFIENVMEHTYGQKHPAYFEAKSRISQSIFAARDDDKELVSSCVGGLFGCWVGLVCWLGWCLGGLVVGLGWWVVVMGWWNLSHHLYGFTGEEAHDEVHERARRGGPRGGL